jgi:hypothetical protein
MHTHRFLLPALAAACINLTACGEAPDDRQQISHTQTSAISAPLLDNEGRPLGSGAQSEPADAGARTRAGLYASEAQAAQLEAGLGDRAISTRVDGSANQSDAVDLAVLVVYGAQAAHDLDSHAPVLVRGKDLRLAAAAANRLHAGGFTRVFLVTQ